MKSTEMPQGFSITDDAGVALVAGATGALGGRIVLRLLAGGWRVYVAGRNAARLDVLAAAGAVVVTGDDGTRGAVPTARGAEAAGLRPDIIINAAGIGVGTFDRSLLHGANVAVLEPLIALARATPACLLVQLSTPATQFVFADRIGLREDAPFTPPISPYAASKQDAERLLRAASGVAWCILRVRAGYGHGAPSMVESLRAKVRASRLPLVRGGKAVIDLVHVDDIADAVAAVGHNRAAMRGMTANVAGPQALSFREITEVLARCENRVPRYVPVPASAILAAGAGFNAGWAWAGWAGEPPLSRHAAGALVYAQTLDLSVLKAKTGWQPVRRFGDHACLPQAPCGQ